MGRWVLIDAGSAGILVLLWYAWFARYNRRRAAKVLDWVQAASLGKGRLSDAKWQASSSLLKATLHLSSRWFDQARLTIRLLPRPLPLQWILCRWRRQEETLTFEADMGYPPGFHLDIIRHRWSGQTSGKKSLENLDNKPAGARHPDHKRRLARRIDSGRKRARHLARQGICNRAFQPAVAPLHRNGSARKFVGPEIGGVVVGIVPRASRKLVRKAALEHVVRRSLSVVRSSQIPTRGQLRYFAIVPTMLFKQTIRQLGSESF